MSSHYSCIITRESIEVKPEIPHFKIGDVFTIPIGADQDDVESFLKFYSEGNLQIPAEFRQDSDEEAEEDDDENLPWVLGKPEKVLVVLQSLGLILKSFIVLHDADFADMPTDHFEAAFQGGYLVKGTYYSYDEEREQPYTSAFDLLEISTDAVEYHRDFPDAANFYVESILKPGPWRSL